MEPSATPASLDAPNTSDDGAGPSAAAARVARSLIGGRSATTGPNALDVFNPATGQVTGHLMEADAAEVDQAVRAARGAFDRSDWPTWSTSKRQSLLLAIRDIIQANADELARLECLALGVPLRELKNRHVLRAAENFRFFAEYIGQAQGEVFDQIESL